jgi:hypothetical protein
MLRETARKKYYNVLYGRGLENALWPADVGLIDCYPAASELRPVHLPQVVVGAHISTTTTQMIGSGQGRTALRDQTHRRHWLLQMQLSSLPKLAAAARQSRAEIHTTGTLTPRKMLCGHRCQTSLGALVSMKSCVGRPV